MAACCTPAVSYILSAARWAVDNDLFLEDFVRRYPLPHAGIVTKGQYVTVGAPNVANPNLRPYVLVHSTQKVRKVLGQLVKLKEGKKKSPTEHRVAIPETFKGYFEILSEDCRPAKCLETVMELCKIFPEMCLVRQSCKAYLPDDDGELRNLYRSRTVHEGELLTLVGQFNFKRTLFLRCFDDQGRSVYLKLSQKGKFSAVSTEAESVAGVHTIEGLMNKRLPLTVRMVHGDCPGELAKAVGGHPLALQLTSTYFDDLVLICSLQKNDMQVHAVPIKSHLRVSPALNQPVLKSRSEFDEIAEFVDDVCNDLLGSVTVFGDASDLPVPVDPTSNDKNNIININNNNNSNTHSSVGGNDENAVFVNRSPAAGVVKGTNDPPIVPDEEIDQLYDYIRGLAPKPKDAAGLKAKRAGSRERERIASNGFGLNNKPNTNNNYHAPPPPPIETIPSKRSTGSGSTGGKVQLKVEIRQRGTTDTQRSGSTTKNSATIKTSGGNSSSFERSTRNRSPSPRRRRPTTDSEKRRLWKSTDKLSYSPPPPYRVSPPPSDDDDDEKPERVSAKHSTGSGGNQKRRPFSMVVPDNVPFFAIRPPMGPVGGGPGYPNPMHHHHHPGPMHPMMRPPLPPGFYPNQARPANVYASANNLNFPPQQQHHDFDKIPPSSNGPFGFPVFRSAVYPRFTPNYYHHHQHPSPMHPQPVYRHPG